MQLPHTVHAGLDHSYAQASKLDSILQTATVQDSVRS